MATRGIHLQYRFENSAGDAPTSQQGAQVQNPLFDALLAVREHGSICRILLNLARLSDTPNG